MREGYKETSVGVIPQDWEVGSLGENCNINMGQSPSSDTYNDSYGLPLIQGNADIKNRVTFPRNYTSEPTKTCNIDDIIMTVRAPVGAIAKSKHEACIGRGVCSITPQKTSIDYTYQYLISYEDQWSKLEQGSTFTAVNGADIKKLSIPLPPLPEQEKIASILTTVDDKIESIDKQIESATELKKGLMQKLFQEGIGHTEFKDSPVGRIPAVWEVYKVKKYCNGIVYGPRFNASNYSESGNVKTIRGTDITENDKINYFQVPLALLEEEVVRLHTLKHHDLIMITTADCGRTTVFEQQEIPYIASAYAVKISLDNEIMNPYFFYYLMQTELGNNQVQNHIRKGTVANLPASDIYNFKLPIPSLVEQEKIVHILTLSDDKISILKEKKEAYTELKKGLMQKLLTGEVRVKVDV